MNAIFTTKGIDDFAMKYLVEVGALTANAFRLRRLRFARMFVTPPLRRPYAAPSAILALRLWGSAASGRRSHEKDPACSMCRRIAAFSLSIICAVGSRIAVASSSIVAVVVAVAASTISRVGSSRTSSGGSSSSANPMQHKRAMGQACWKTDGEAAATCFSLLPEMLSVDVWPGSDA